MNRNSDRLAIIGCGVMGIGIAATAVGFGIDVTLIETDERARESAESRLRNAMRHGQLMAAFPENHPPGGVQVTDLLAPIGDCYAIIEAITENVSLKMQLLRKIQDIARADVPIVTNTSGILVDTLAATLRSPGRVIGVHFMNPAYLINMVEVVRGRHTTDETLETTRKLLSLMDRRAVVVGDSPGFVTSRLLHAMINDAANLVGEQVAAPGEIDALMQGCLGHPTGPLRTADLIGLDNLVDSLTTLYARTTDKRYKPSSTLLALVAAGDFGRKTGKGFYNYGEAIRH